MVSGSRLLLILALLSACKAESVGVMLPKGGRDAISQEDLQRDAWMLTQIPNRAQQITEEAFQIQQRFQQMHTRPGFDRSYTDSDGNGSAAVVCAEKEGGRSSTVLILAEDSGAAVADGALPVAALISLLKGVDTATPPPRTLVVCALLGTGARERFLSHPPMPLKDVTAVFRLGPLGDGEALAAGAPIAMGDLAVTPLRLGDVPAVDAMESVDYRVLRDAVVEILDRALEGALP